MSPEQRAPSLDVIAWLAAVPTAALSLAAILWLAPPLADVMLPSPNVHFMSVGFLLSKPEPVELMRFGLAIAAPAALAALLIAGADKARPLAELPGTAAVLLLQVGLAAFLGVCWFAQRDADPWGLPLTTYFSLRDVLVALVVAAGLGLLAARGTGLLRRADGFARRSRWRLLAPVAGAALITGLWLLPAVFRAGNIGDNVAVLLHLQTDFDEFLAVANGRTPMVDFAAQYTNLLPYPVDWTLSIVGYSIGSFTAAMWALSIAALMSAYAALARVTASRLAALCLYVPFLAISLYPVCDTGQCSGVMKPDERLFMANLYQVFPIRYLGPFVLAWLLARHLGGLAPRRPLVLFVLAALTAVNNTDFGLACFCATFFGLWLASDERAIWRRGLWLAGQAALGLFAACVLVSAFTLLRAGALPDPDVIFYFPRLFGRAGFGMLPMPTLGFQLIVYTTLAGALVYAAVRKASGDPGAVLTGTLAYGAVLGLGASIYYAGRSTPSTLVGMFSAWGFVVALLTWAVVKAPRLWRPVRQTALARSLLPAIFVLFTFGLMASSITRFPRPWTEARRIAENTGVGPLVRTAAVTFVSKRTVPGEKVAILEGLGHGIARDSKVVDVSPFNNPGNIVTVEQMDYLRRSLDEAGGRKVFTATNVYEPINEYLRRAGYVPVATDAASRLVEWQAPPRAASAVSSTRTRRGRR